MACRMDVRESKAKEQAGITNNNGVQISRCFQAVRKRRRVHLRSPIPRVIERRQPPLVTRRFNAYVVPERRRIVAQVRREVLKNRDFLAVRDSLGDATIC